MQMNRQWMYADSRNKQFIDGLNGFLNVAEANRAPSGFMCCPCSQCKNLKSYKDRGRLHFHLLSNGFMSNYSVWTKHGERGVIMDADEEDEVDNDIPVLAEYYRDFAMGDADQEDDRHEEAAEENTPTDGLGQMLRDAEKECDNEKELKKIQRMLEDLKTDLYPDCKEGLKKLGTTLEFLQWKAANGVTDKGFEELLKLVKKILPEGNELPSSTYEAKRVVCPLGLEVQKIHACPNDCILYRGAAYENLDCCPVCSCARYKIRREDPGEVDGENCKKKIPAKVMWYFPLIPRLKRLFRNKEHSKMMRWHKEERKRDGMLRHPADGSQWRNIDRAFPEFDADTRNVRLGLSTDGMNPFGDMSSTHSTWPVTVCIYNLPPWLCMKRKFIMMPVLIQGPKQPGNDIDVYLRPLVDELLQLWKEEGVSMWDEYKQEEFDLRALLFISINDWPALSNLSGQTNKGYKACTHCYEDTESIYLKHCKKVVYMGHRRFLPTKHELRKKCPHFGGNADHRAKPVHRNGQDVFDMVKDVEVIFGKGDGSQPVKTGEDGRAAMWKKKSIFWELPYWPFLEVRNAIDVMHLTKNLCVNLISFLGTYGKPKDTLEARQELKRLNLRTDLHPEKRDKGRQYLRPASFTLSKEEKASMFECLNSIKVPSGYSSNVKGITNMKEKKFINLKSHDCHVLMTQLLPVILRGVLPVNVRKAIVKLCAFLNAISQKVINPDHLDQLQNDVVQCLVSFEMIFPPSFFNIMTHLLVHVVKEIRILGPVFLHNMFPFERYFSVLKKYVRNRARPEGSIAKGYETEEVIEFCVDFMEGLSPIGVPESHHEGRLGGMGTLGKKSMRIKDTEAFRKAHLTVLHQSSLVAPYIEEHKNILWDKYPDKSSAFIQRQHNLCFAEWLRDRLMGVVGIDPQLAFLARGPSTTILKFEGYDINGYTFYTRGQDKKSTNQNSGVRIDATDSSGKNNSYYGVIEEIWELEYGNLKVPLFKCQWVKLTAGGVTIDDYGMTIVDLNKIGFLEEPFVLAKDVTQVFYVKDMASKPKKGKSKQAQKRKSKQADKGNIEEADPSSEEPKRHIVLPGKRKIVGVEDKTDEDYDMLEGRPPFSVAADPSILLAAEETPYLRRDHNQGTFVRRKFVAVRVNNDAV